MQIRCSIRPLASESRFRRKSSYLPENVLRVSPQLCSVTSPSTTEILRWDLPSSSCGRDSGPCGKLPWSAGFYLGGSLQTLLLLRAGSDIIHKFTGAIPRPYLPSATVTCFTSMAFTAQAMLLHNAAHLQQTAASERQIPHSSD